MRTTTPLFLLTPLILLSCGDVTEPEGVREIRIVPSPISLAVGETKGLQLEVVTADGVVKLARPERWETSYSTIADIDADGTVRGVSTGFARIIARLDQHTLSVPVAVGRITFENIDSVLSTWYRDRAPPDHRISSRDFIPAVALDATTIDTPYPKDATRWISTAWINGRFTRYYVYPDGRVDASWSSGRRRQRFAPAGVQRVLVLIVDGGETNIRQIVDTAWPAAQDSVNGDHRALAASLGYAQPMVWFENTNRLVSAASLSTPNSRDSVFAYLERIDVDPMSFDYVVSLDLDLDRRGAWASIAGDFAYIGCVGCPPASDGPVARLERSGLDRIARTMYHHEIGHLWDWMHEWGGGPVGTRIITNPVLLGWTDVDGDGIPEAIDPTPYGTN